MAKNKTRSTFVRIMITAIVGAIITWVTEWSWVNDKKEKHGKK